MLQFLDFFVSFKDYHFTFWLGVITFCFWAGDMICQPLFGRGLRDIPSALKPVILLMLAALLTPMAVEAALALAKGKLPDLQESEWSMSAWSMLGLTAWISFVSMSITCLLYQFSEPVKEELFARVPRPWSMVNYLVTAVLAAIIYFGSFGGLVYIYSFHRIIPLFTKEHLLLLSAAYVGTGLALALLLRTFGWNRWVSDMSALMAASVLTYSLAENFDLPDVEWINATIVFSTLTWALLGFAQLVKDMIRFRKKVEGEPLSEGEQDRDKRLAHICSVCSREFVTLHGLRIHAGKMHKKVAEG